VTATVEQSPRTRGYAVAAAIPVVCLGVILTAVLTLLVGIIGLAVGVVLTVAAVVVRVRTFGRGIEDQVLERLGVRAADGDDAAGLHNLVNGLSATIGVPVPDLYVIDESTSNLLVIGTSPDSAAVVVTTGLLGSVSRIELEGVVARALAQIRQGDLVATTMAVRLERAPATRLFAEMLDRSSSADDSDRNVLLDRAAVVLTRYPPGLMGALQACQRSGTVVGVTEPAIARLWMVDPTDAAAARIDLERRIEALRLL
jgi:heat shock protein HtpX